VTASRGRRRPCTPADARIRAAHARAYLETAKLIHSEANKPDDVNFNHVAAGNTVLAAIAASDALCCKLLGERSRGQDHREAVGLLEQVRFGEGTAATQARRARHLARALATRSRPQRRLALRHSHDRQPRTPAAHPSRRDSGRSRGSSRLTGFPSASAGQSKQTASECRNIHLGPVRVTC
jgi:hypothetical protein